MSGGKIRALAQAKREKQVGRKLNRQEKAALNRTAFIDAAAQVIGAVGYEKASIAKIAEAAGLAHGTFYLYFTDRQELFDQILPLKGLEIMRFLRNEVREATTVIEMERLGLLGFQKYIERSPWFFRLLHEGRSATPKGHATHMSNLVTAFKRALRRWQSQGQLPDFTDEQLETLSLLMIGARDYLFVKTTVEGPVFQPLTESKLEVYLTVLESGILGEDAAGARRTGS